MADARWLRRWRAGADADGALHRHVGIATSLSSQAGQHVHLRREQLSIYTPEWLRPPSVQTPASPKTNSMGSSLRDVARPPAATQRIHGPEG
jgi:hypothetical protein